MVAKKTAEVTKVLDSTLQGLANVIEHRDLESGEHVKRTQLFVKALTDHLIETESIYADELKKFQPDIIMKSMALHDVGKIAIPIAVLSKPGRLTNEEFEVMKTHSLEGKRIIDKIISRLGSETEFLRNAKLFAGYHHERWDGKGYPHGLNRLNIPLQGRIMAIVDVYDALVSERPYKKPFTPEEAVKIIMDSTGEMFDPLIAETFFEVRGQFEKVS
jgi:putative two-component system response regulator